MDWIARIMGSNGGEARDAADLKEIVDCLDGLAKVEQRMERIQEGRLKHELLRKVGIDEIPSNEGPHA
jgi:hypothetical protein